MLELLQTAPMAPVDQLPEQAPSLLGTVKDLALPMAAVFSAYKIGRPLAVGHVLPEDTSDIDLSKATATRDPRAVIVMAIAYAAGVGLTAAGVYLLTSLAWALTWAGTWALIASAIALLAAKDASPIDDVRAVLEARRQNAD